MSYVTAHILDASAGRPAPDVAVTLTAADGTEIATARTNSDGRVPDLGPDTLPAGHYVITFATGDYFAARQQDTFYPVVVVHFAVSAGEAHYHVPLLLSPYAYSTYRGS